MFFIGIFGIETKQKEIKRISECLCKECRTGELILYKQFNMFHFFFIPLFKWGVKYYLVCKDCNTVYEISMEKGKAVEEDREDITYWDLKVLQRGNVKVHCSNCNREVNEEFEYCPHCGSKI